LERSGRLPRLAREKRVEGLLLPPEGPRIPSQGSRERDHLVLEAAVPLHETEHPFPRLDRARSSSELLEEVLPHRAIELTGETLRRFVRAGFEGDDERAKGKEL